MHYRLIVASITTLLILLALSHHASAQPIIINELYNAGSNNDEWIELLVVQDGLDLRNWDIRDFSGSGAAQQPLVFNSVSMWSNLKAGTLITIGRPENSFTEDLDPSDYTMTVKSSNTAFFTGTVFNLAGTSDAVQVRDAADSHVIGVSWGGSNASSIPAPKVHFGRSSSSGTSINFTQGSLGVITDTSQWVFNGSTSSRGMGNSAANTNWINTLRARPEGSGSNSIVPLELSGSTDTTVTITYWRDTAFTITRLRVIVPSEFTWSRNDSDVSFTDMSATLTVSGDTVDFADVVLSADSTVITLQHLTSPFYTGYYQFVVQSGTTSALGNVSPTLQIAVYGASIPIADTKVNDTAGVAVRFGDLVTVRGIVTVANEFGSPSYIQDPSAGMSVFGSTFSTAVSIGDEVLVSGRVTQFNGLNQIEQPTLHEILSSGNTVEPIVVTPTQLKSDGVGGTESFEGLFVRLNGVTVAELNGTPVTTWQASRNYRITGTSPDDTVQLRIDNNTDLVGAVAPAGTFDVVGVVGQYKTTPPYIGGYQVMARSRIDIISEGPIFAQSPYEHQLQPTSLTISFMTLNPGTSRVRYGRTRSYELGVAESDDSLRTEHHISLTGLDVATIYQVQAFSVSGSDTSFAGNLVVSTTSAPPTTGEINVYFNKSVNTAVALGETARANVNLVQKLFERINNSRRSIDVALYSLSGTVGASIASSLVSAHNRGVKVRVIGEYDNRSTAPWTTLSNASIPVIFDLYGSNDGAGLHHNKFFVFDYRGGAPESVWVWTGSWNPTDPGTNDDRQNSIEIQDVALAGAYTAEFEEEWGSSTDTPNASASRFGARKTDNTPHNFVLGGTPVQVFFSPSDRTTKKIGETLARAQSSVSSCMYTFTRRELSDTIIALKNKGRKVRMVFDDITDSVNTRYFALQSAGVDVHTKGFSGGLLHHKYAIVDGTQTGGEQYVITGSHNWTSSAENSNDENTLILQDNRVANLYLQEFAARYYEAGGTDPIVLGVEDVGNGIPASYSLEQNYPNPFNPFTIFDFRLPIEGRVALAVYDVLGREVATLVDEIMQPGGYRVRWDATGMPSGVYFYRLQAGSFTQTRKMILLR